MSDNDSKSDDGEPRKRRKLMQDQSGDMQSNIQPQFSQTHSQEQGQAYTESDRNPLTRYMNALVETEQNLIMKKHRNSFFQNSNNFQGVKRQVGFDSDDSESEGSYRQIKQEPDSVREFSGPHVKKQAEAKVERPAPQKKNKILRSLQINYNVTQISNNPESQRIEIKSDLNTQSQFTKELRELNKSLKRLESMFMMQLLKNN